MPRLCSVADCKRPHIARGYCTTHYAWHRRHGLEKVVFEEPPVSADFVGRLCVMEGCNRKHLSRSLCGRHYKAARVAGMPILKWDDVAVFHHGYIRKGPDECWEWQRSKASGYGEAWFQGRKIRAPRLAWQFANGNPPPADMDVLHQCDNPPCVNPKHLFLGTAKDNYADAMAKGRLSNKLNPTQVKTLRRHARQGVAVWELARAFRISEGHTANVIARRVWKEVSDS